MLDLLFDRARASDIVRISTASLFKVTEIQEFDIHPDGERAICSVNTGGN